MFDRGPIFRRRGSLSICEIFARQLNHRYSRIRGKVARLHPVKMATDTPAAPRYTRNNPFPAKLAVNRSLCGEGSEKDTRHFEVDLKGWGLNYEVGDSMTVWPTNDPALVDEIIQKIGAKGGEPVKGPDGNTTLREALFRDCRITQTTPRFVKTM